MKDEKVVPKDVTSDIDEAKIEKTNSETEELQSKITELNDKYLRAMAEMENTRRRASMDAQAAARVRAIAVAEKFLPLIDAISAALEHQPENKDFESLMLTASGSLESAGIKKIESVGQLLNPMLHNAVHAEESDEPSGTIIQEFQSGYILGDVVLRPSGVIVAK
jgi:molecular chaperone GrpE